MIMDNTIKFAPGMESTVTFATLLCEDARNNGTETGKMAASFLEFAAAKEYFRAKFADDTVSTVKWNRKHADAVIACVSCVLKHGEGIVQHRFGTDADWSDLSK